MLPGRSKKLLKSSSRMLSGRSKKLLIGLFVLSIIATVVLIVYFQFYDETDADPDPDVDDKPDHQPKWAPCMRLQNIRLPANVTATCDESVPNYDCVKTHLDPGWDTKPATGPNDTQTLQSCANICDQIEGCQAFFAKTKGCFISRTGTQENMFRNMREGPNISEHIVGSCTLKPPVQE
jgi:hypothetical protein